MAKTPDNPEGHELLVDFDDLEKAFRVLLIPWGILA
jgi:hypothetical protein